MGLTWRDAEAQQSTGAVYQLGSASGGTGAHKSTPLQLASLTQRGPCPPAQSNSWWCGNWDRVSPVHRHIETSSTELFYSFKINSPLWSVKGEYLTFAVMFPSETVAGNKVYLCIEMLDLQSGNVCEASLKEQPRLWLTDGSAGTLCSSWSVRLKIFFRHGSREVIVLVYFSLSCVEQSDGELCCSVLLLIPQRGPALQLGKVDEVFDNPVTGVAFTICNKLQQC